MCYIGRFWMFVARMVGCFVLEIVYPQSQNPLILVFGALSEVTGSVGDKSVYWSRMSDLFAWNVCSS